MLPKDSIASCSDLRQLFERRAQRKASFAAPQTELRDAGFPVAKRRDAESRVAFSLGTYLLAKQKKVPRLAGRDPPSGQRWQSRFFLN
jgi:hypothetical protein